MNRRSINVLRSTMASRQTRHAIYKRRQLIGSASLTGSQVSRPGCTTVRTPDSMRSIYSLARLGKLHVDTQRNWSAKGHPVHYVVWGSVLRPHRIKIDEEEGNIIMTHETDRFMVCYTTLIPIKLVLMPCISPDFQLTRNTALGLRELDFLTLLLHD
jgi:hypothetical protein